MNFGFVKYLKKYVQAQKLNKIILFIFFTCNTKIKALI